MTTKFNCNPNVLVTLVMFIVFTSQSYGQNVFDKIKQKGKERLAKTTDIILNGEKQKGTDKKPDSDTRKTTNNDNNAKTNTKKLGEPSIIKESDFIQNPVLPKKAPNDTRFRIADNLFVDMKGKYPVGYAPKWSIVFNKSSVTFDVENYITQRSSLGHGGKSISITNYNGKAVLRYGGFINADLYADIVINGSEAVITETPQTFKVTNFQTIINERPSGQRYASTNNMYFAGGFEGEITLSANDKGDINMSLVIESFKEESRFSGAGVTYRFLAKNVNIENQITAEKANGIVRAEEEAKQRQKDYEVKTTKQADSLQKVIAKKYPQADCKNCFYSSKGSYISSNRVDDYWVNGYGDASYTGSHTEFDVNTRTVIKNTCNYPLTFIGIQQFYDDQNGYHLKEVTKTMDVEYNYSSNQGAFASVLTSLLGAGSEFDIVIQDRYVVKYARVGSVQWLKVIKLMKERKG